MIIRGTTPAFVIRIENGSFSAYDEGYLTIRQDAKQLDIPFSEGTIVDNVLYLPRLKQEETLLFDATKQIKLQLKLRQLDNVTATNIVRLSAYPILSENVLETNGMTSGNTIEVTLHLLDAETIEVSAQIVEIAINSDIREHINATVSTEWQALYDSGALTGPRGERGERGERGLRGLDGQPGPAGPAGRDGSDYVITQADYNAIANVTETLIQPTLDNKMEYYLVECHNNVISHDGVTLGFNELVDLYNNPKVFLYMETLNLTLIPNALTDNVLTFSTSYFNSTDSHIYQVDINSDNVVTSHFNSLEVETNKITSINARNKNDEKKYTSVKAVTSYVDEAIPTNTSELTNDSGFITRTDYANHITLEAGTLRITPNNAMYVSTGFLAAATKTLAQYNTLAAAAFIGKGTLGNVLSQYMKSQALTQAEYDAIVEKDNGTLYVIVED